MSVTQCPAVKSGEKICSGGIIIRLKPRPASTKRQHSLLSAWCSVN